MYHFQMAFRAGFRANIGAIFWAKVILLNCHTGPRLQEDLRSEGAGRAHGRGARQHGRRQVDGREGQGVGRRREHTAGITHLKAGNLPIV